MCGAVLDRWSGLGWAHSAHAGREAADHPAVPVPFGQVPARERCDFCWAKDPMLVLPVASFTLGGGVGSDGDWACCETCAGLVATNQWSSLTRRCLASWEARHGAAPEEVRSGLARLYRQVRRRALGPPRPTLEPGG